MKFQQQEKGSVRSSIFLRATLSAAHLVLVGGLWYNERKELAGLALAVAEGPGSGSTGFHAGATLQTQKILNVVHAGVRQGLLPVQPKLHQGVELLLQQRVLLRRALVLEGRCAVGAVLKSLSRDVFAAKRLDVLGRRGPGQQGESEARHHDSGEGDLPPRPPHDPPLPRHHYTCSGPPWTQSWTPSASASASPKFPPEISAEPAAAPSFSPGRRGSRECRPPSSIETETGTRPQEEHDALRPKQLLFQVLFVLRRNEARHPQGEGHHRGGRW